MSTPWYETGSATLTNEPYKTLLYRHPIGNGSYVGTDIKARMILDSISAYGVRLTTMELTYWLMVHQDQQTHRTIWKTDSAKFEQWLDKASNSSSNRALSPARIDAQIASHPYIPLFCKATPQMIGGPYLEGEEYWAAQQAWINYRDRTEMSLQEFNKLPARVHKQQFNRARSPFQLITTVMTANEEWWQHFFNLRDHVACQPDLAVPAGMAHELYISNNPHPVSIGDWHMPYVAGTMDAAVYPTNVCVKISAARCARTSYLRQGELLPVRDDMALYEDLSTSMPPHDSPREHPCTPIGPQERSGCYVGWSPLRHQETAA